MVGTSVGGLDRCRLWNYAHLAGPDRIAWVLAGEVVARGPDDEPLVQLRRALAVIDDAVLDEARRLYEDRIEMGRAATD